MGSIYYLITSPKNSILKIKKKKMPSGRAFWHSDIPIQYKERNIRFVQTKQWHSMSLITQKKKNKTKRKTTTMSVTLNIDMKRFHNSTNIKDQFGQLRRPRTEQTKQGKLPHEDKENRRICEIRICSR